MLPVGFESPVQLADSQVPTCPPPGVHSSAAPTLRSVHPPLWCVGSGAARLAIFDKTAPIESNTHKVVSGSMITLRACRGAEQRKEGKIMKPAEWTRSRVDGTV
jgi:hypothetical protein